MQNNLSLKSIPNMLTALRILLIPVLVASFYFEQAAADYITVGIFIFASLTDYVDGILARRWRAQSDFGRMLDPIADKMLIASTLLMMVESRIAPAVPIVVILCREICVSGMREYMAGVRITLRVTLFAKVKTAIQMVAIIVLLANDKLERFIRIPEWLNLHKLGLYSLWIAAILTVVTGYAYVRETLIYLRQNNNNYAQDDANEGDDNKQGEEAKLTPAAQQNDRKRQAPAHNSNDTIQ